MEGANGTENYGVLLEEGIGSNLFLFRLATGLRLLNCENAKGSQAV